MRTKAPSKRSARKPARKPARKVPRVAKLSRGDPSPQGKPAPRRKPGRPSALASADQRARLLDAALALFAEQGIAAAPLRAIARRAGVTPALLHYYFASKDSLVETILAERVAPFVATSVAPLLESGPSPRATLRRFVELHMRNIAANPWMPRLMLREVLSEGGLLREHVQAHFAATLAPKVFALIVAAQRRGEIRADLNPMLIGLSLVSLAVFPFAATPLWRAVALSYLRGTQFEPYVKQAQAMARDGAAAAANAEPLIQHTLALIDRALEPSHAKKH